MALRGRTTQSTLQMAPRLSCIQGLMRILYNSRPTTEVDDARLSPSQRPASTSESRRWPITPEKRRAGGVPRGGTAGPGASPPRSGPRLTPARRPWAQHADQPNDDIDGCKRWPAPGRPPRIGLLRTPQPPQGGVARLCARHGHRAAWRQARGRRQRRWRRRRRRRARRRPLADRTAVHAAFMQCGYVRVSTGMCRACTNTFA